jgi:hypothetical protein
MDEGKWRLNQRGENGGEDLTIPNHVYIHLL